MPQSLDDAFPITSRRAVPSNARQSPRVRNRSSRPATHALSTLAGAGLCKTALRIKARSFTGYEMPWSSKKSMSPFYGSGRRTHAGQRTHAGAAAAAAAGESTPHEFELHL
eukprot:5870931-Prymnesium_polylepis.1